MRLVVNMPNYASLSDFCGVTGVVLLTQKKVVRLIKIAHIATIVFLGIRRTEFERTME